MANQWFRLYSEFANDPKVQMMSEVMQRRLIMLFCERCSDVLVTLHETELAFHWRISEVDLAETKAVFLAKGFIDEQWNLLNWNKRQFDSDSSTERTRRYRERVRTSRERHSDDDSDVSVTKSETSVTSSDALEQNRTDTEQNRTREAGKPDLTMSQEKSPSMVATMVIQTLGLGGDLLARALADVAKHELAAGKTETGVAEEMVASWREYVVAAEAGKLGFTCKPQTFFGEAKWRNRALWGWKEGQQPTPKRVYANVKAVNQ